MNARGIAKIVKKDRRYYIKFLSITYFSLMVFCFAFFAFYHRITDLVFAEDKIDILKDDLEQVAFYFHTFDPSLSEFVLTIDDVSKAYSNGENIMKTKADEIEEIWEYIKNNRHYLQKLGFSHYEPLFDFLDGLRDNKDEVFTLLGNDEPFNYLIVLQNRNEKRPNGGFFGSFAFVKISEGHIQDLEVVDAYYPDFIAYRTHLVAPSWTSAFLPERKIGFIASNKFGFTDIDGKNIKTLYEKMFNETFTMWKVEQTMEPEMYNKLLHQNIKGVIFLRSDFVEYLLPGFQSKAWEWQFTNASVDLIRGEERGNKKEHYVREVKDFFDRNKKTMTQNFVNNFDKILDSQFVHIYLSNVSQELQNFVEESHLTNTYKTGFLYAWDTNTSYNKVDGFVDKQIQIIDQFDNILIDTDNDITNIEDLEPGNYKMNISYTLQIPDYYRKFIKKLEEKYAIKITDRERGILALQPALYKDGEVQKWRESKSTVYFPPNYKVSNVQGEYLEQKQFWAPFANGLYYKMRINENYKTKTISMDLQIQ